MVCDDRRLRVSTGLPAHQPRLVRVRVRVRVCACVGVGVGRGRGIVTTDRQQPQEGLLAAVPNLQCLADLPPITPGCARIYLCRHGQTENNRLRKVQGARVDPSLNAYGAEMALRIGMALSLPAARWRRPHRRRA